MHRLKTHGDGNGNDVNYDHATDEAARARKQADEDDFNRAVASRLITLRRGPRRPENFRREILLTGRSASDSFKASPFGVNGVRDMCAV